MSRIPLILRILLGLAFTVFGLNHFLGFMPAPEPPPAEGAAFLFPFAVSGYLGLVKGIEVVAGLLLLANRFVPLALALLAPIIVGITYYHAALDPAGIVPALVFTVLEIALAWFYRDAFLPMLRAKVSPAPATASQPRETRAVAPASV